MAPNPLHGRHTRVGPVDASQRRKTAPDQGVGYAMAQSPPSTAPAPRFRAPQLTQPYPYQAPNQSPQWRGGDNTNDQLIVRDRAPQFNRGTETGGRNTYVDPPKDGPIRPSLRLVNRTWNWQVGMGTGYADDLTRPYTWVGEQGAGWTTVYGGAPGFYRQGPGGAPVGDPSMGSARVWGGPPHGFHTYYPPDGAQTQATYRARPQMVPGRVDRLSNSRIAGQNYSQWTHHQGGGQQ